MSESRAVESSGPDQVETTPAVRVLYIGGSNRSGSTLLDRMLDQIDGLFSTGELVNIWTRFLTGERLCGCGRQMSECELWHRVGEIAFGGWDQVDLAAVQALAARSARTRLFPLMLLPRIWPPYRKRAEEYGTVLRRLYAAIAEVTGAEIIVDSSKSPGYALFLHRAGFDVRVLHLVRDSRGVANSLLRRRLRADVPDGRGEMPTKAAAATALAWLLVNLLTEALRLVGVPTCRLRYENLAADPVEVLRPALSDLAELDSPSFDFIEPGEVRLRLGHTVDGNPMRVDVGLVRLAPNERWITELSTFDRLVVAILTWPLLGRYGYLGGSRRPR